MPPIPGPWSHHVLLSLFLTIAVAGCTGSSPRFRSEDRDRNTVPQEENEFRFAAKIREEESREDDRKIDEEAFRARVLASPAVTESLSTSPEINRDRFLLDLVSFLGVPYRHGGMAKSGMDCSGLTKSVYSSSMNLSLPRSTREQFESGVPVHRSELRFGDLVFFNTTGRSPSHVGIYIEADLFAHASVTSGVTLSSLESTYYRKRFVGARRVVP